MARDFTINTVQFDTYEKYVSRPIGDMAPYNNIRCLYSASEGLYASGIFNGYFQKMARWDGNNWYSLGDGIWSEYDILISQFESPILSVTKYKNKIYAGGRPYNEAYDSRFNINAVAYKYENNTWSPITYNGPEGIYYTKYMLVVDDILYMCGWYGEEDNGTIHTVLKYDGNVVTRVDDGENNSEATCLFFHDSSLYVGYYNNETSSNIRKYNGTSWSNLPSLLGQSGNNYIGAINFYKGYICASTWAGKISRFISNTWQEVEGLSGIKAFTVHNEKIYAVGAFSNGYGLADWNNIEWNFVDKKLSTSNVDLVSLLISNNDIYVCSMFGGEKFNEDSGSFISRWDGDKWNLLSNNNIINNDYVPIENSLVNHIISSSEGLYLFGAINDAIKLWNGYEYTSLSGNIETSFQNIAVSSSDGLYTTCYENSLPQDTLVSKWDGSIWTAITNSDDPVSRAYSLYSCSSGIYISNDSRVYLWDGLSLNYQFDYPYVDSMVSSSTGLYFTSYYYTGEDPQLNLWTGETIITVQPPEEGLSLIISKPHKNIALLNDKVYCLFYYGAIFPAGIYSYNGTGWDFEIELPIEWSFYGDPSYYIMVGSSNDKIFLCSVNPLIIDENTINSNPYSLLKFESGSLNKVIDTNSYIFHVIEEDDNIYVCGTFTRQGFKVAKINKFVSQQIKPLFTSNKNAISIRKNMPYKSQVE